MNMSALFFGVCSSVSDHVNVTVCVIRALIRASHKKQRSFVGENCVCVCMLVHVYTIECVSAVVCVHMLMWLYECVKPICADFMSVQCAVLRDKGVLLQ